MMSSQLPKSSSVLPPASLREPEVIPCLRGDGHVEPLYKWQCDTSGDLPSVVIVHDLWEDIGFYKKEIQWWLTQNRQVFIFNINYFGSQKNTKFAGNFSKICYNILQIIALVRTMDNMRAPLVCARGVGALIVTKIARKNSKFLAGLIATGPLYALKEPPGKIKEKLIQSCCSLLPGIRLPKMLMPHMSEQTLVSTMTRTEEFSDEGWSDVGQDDDANHAWQEKFQAFGLREFWRIYECPDEKNEFGRLTFKALYEYLYAMKNSPKICSRIKVPCLFILPLYSQHLDYEVLYKVQKKYGAMMQFEIQKTSHFYKIIESESSPEFFAVTDRLILPWLDKMSAAEHQNNSDQMLPESNELDADTAGTRLTESFDDSVQ
ncbi:MAG: alpha/beta hydrolase [Proteobacteria bacterium]|nr:alpha/beta hydrolase [Pseudomonadota bacterium]